MAAAKLSVVMIARNAAERLPEVLGAVSWADEICVCDTGSSDNTYDVARSLGAEVQRIDFNGFGPAKQRAVDMASHDWVFSLDSDEIVDKRLARSIRGFLADPGIYSGARFPRVTNFCGHWILHSGWYPEFVFRIFNRKQGSFDNKPVHESLQCKGEIRTLTGNLLHYSYPEISVYRSKIREYSALGASLKRGSPYSVKFLFMCIKPMVVFLKKLIIQRGFADGLPGLWIACFSAYGQLLKYYYALKHEKSS